jgi:hypothetical protein
MNVAGGAGSDRRAPWACTRLLGVTVVLAVVAPSAAVAGEDTPRRPEPPKEWEEELAPFADTVEDLRGLRFEHPVEVSFLDDAAFERERGLDTDLTKREREELEYTAGTLRALGLFDGDADDLLEQVLEIDAGGTAAFYNTRAERIVIRGGDIGVENQATVVHELVHALQDQHFDLDALSDDAEDSGGENALAALVEGDAERIQADYVAGLGRDERAAVIAAHDEAAREAEAGLPAGVPEILPVLFSLPYELGPFFVASLHADGGDDAVDEAFREPPVTDEHILDPSTYIDGDEAVTVERVELESGEEKVGPRERFGAVTWYFVLAARIDPVVALEAAEGWGGDELVHFERAGTPCARLAYRGETKQDTREMASALDQWAATLPTGVAQVERGRQLTLTACDPGAGAAPEVGAVFDAAALLGNRALIGSLLHQEAGPFDSETVECAALELARDPAYVDWLGRETTEEENAPFFEQTGEALADCLA